MKYTFPIVVSLTCVGVRALPIPDDHSTNEAGVNGLFGSVGTDVSKLLGSLADQVGARFKRGLLDDASQAISKRVDLITGLTSGEDVKAVLELAGDDADDDRLGPLISELDGEDISDLVNKVSSTLLARSLDGEAEDCTDPSDAGDDTESGQNSPVESSGDTVNNTDNTVSDGFDNSGLIDDSSLTANDIENGVSAEAGDQTDLSKRTIAASVGGVITSIGNTAASTGVIVDDPLDSVGHIFGNAVA